MNAIDPLLTIKDLAQLYKITPRTIYKKVAKGELPTPIRLGPRRTRWRSSEIKAHIDSLRPIKT
jgi:excisionase family DNA binding protein